MRFKRVSELLALRSGRGTISSPGCVAGKPEVSPLRRRHNAGRRRDGARRCPVLTALQHLRQGFHGRLLCALKPGLRQQRAHDHLQGSPPGQVVVVGRVGGLFAPRPLGTGRESSVTPGTRGQRAVPGSFTASARPVLNTSAATCKSWPTERKPSRRAPPRDHRHPPNLRRYNAKWLGFPVLCVSCFSHTLYSRTLSAQRKKHS